MVTDGLFASTTKALTLSIVAPPQIKLVAGWNLIDLPTQNSGVPSASQLVSALNLSVGSGAIKVVGTYTNGRFKLYVPGFSQDLSLNSTQGIFVNSSTAGTWTPAGSIYMAGQPVALHRGWNLVAAPFPVAGLSGAAIASQASGCGVQLVAILSSGSYQTWTPSSSTSLTVASTAGMWVQCSGNGSLTPAG
jgi:hypothetical protein